MRVRVVANGTPYVPEVAAAEEKRYSRFLCRGRRHRSRQCFMNGMYEWRLAQYTPHLAPLLILGEIVSWVYRAIASISSGGSKMV